MKLWQTLYSNLMNEAGTDGGAGGAGGATDPGAADYLNGDSGADQGDQGNANDNNAGANGDAGNGDGADNGNDNNPGDNGGKSLDDGTGLLDEIKDDKGEGGENNEAAPLDDSAFTFELPEGFELADNVKADVIALAKEHKISPEAAQKFVQKHAELKQAELDQAKATINEWKEETLADPDVGGQYIQQTMKNVNKALSVPHGNEVAEILKQTGLQNHPAFVKFLNHYGKLVSNDSNRGTNPTTAPSDQQKLDALYGN